MASYGIHDVLARKGVFPGAHTDALTVPCACHICTPVCLYPFVLCVCIDKSAYCTVIEYVPYIFGN